jgi:phosphohistidine phosphatase
MKTIYLVRHATAAERKQSTPDVDRPLIEKGIKESQKVAATLKKLDIKPQVIVSSPAKRAVQTAEIFAKTLRYAKANIILNQSIYDTVNGESFLLSIQKLDDKKDNVFLFGHEPTISEFASSLLENFQDSLPKTGVIGITFPVEHWRAVKKNKGTINFIHFPKNKAISRKTLKKSIEGKIQSEIQGILNGIHPQKSKSVSKIIAKASKNIAKEFIKQIGKK